MLLEGLNLRKVHTAESLVEVAHLRNVLEEAGIACTLRNERLGGVVGEIPYLECWPELWILEPSQLLRARALIDETLHPSVSGGPWRCDGCGEALEPQFATCWNCGQPRPAEH